MDRTFVACKPDAVERGLSGEIIARFERKGLKLVAAELRTIDRETAGKHYEEHKEKPFFGELVDFITRGPAMLCVFEGPEDTWKVVRTVAIAPSPSSTKASVGPDVMKSTSSPKNGFSVCSA